MRAFVTGALGFVGRRLTPRLESADYQIVSPATEVDVTDTNAFGSSLAGASPDVVIHLAAQSSVAESWRDPEGCFRVNFEGTLNVIQAMLQHCPKARLLFISSGDTYGSRAPGAERCSESEPLRPASPYAQSKAAAERLASFAGEHGLDVVCSRSFNHTGAGQTDVFVASSFAHQLADMENRNAEPLMRVGNLDSVRDFLDVEDAIDAYLDLLAPETPAGTYNVASGRAVSIRELLDCLITLSSVKPEIQTDPERFRATDYLVGDPSLLRQTSGWEAKTPLKETLRELLDAWRQ